MTVCENYEVERQRHNKQMNYTQDSSKKEELPWVGIYIRTYNSFSTTNANFGNRKSIGFSASKKSLCKVVKVSYIDTTASLLVKL